MQASALPQRKHYHLALSRARRIASGRERCLPFRIDRKDRFGSTASPPAVGFSMPTSAAPQKRRPAVKMWPVVKGQSRPFLQCKIFEETFQSGVLPRYLPRPDVSRGDDAEPVNAPPPSITIAQAASVTAGSLPTPHNAASRLRDRG